VLGPSGDRHEPPDPLQSEISDVNYLGTCKLECLTTSDGVKRFFSLVCAHLILVTVIITLQSVPFYIRHKQALALSTSIEYPGVAVNFLCVNRVWQRQTKGQAGLFLFP
jgi:hypothetical protein